MLAPGWKRWLRHIKKKMPSQPSQVKELISTHILSQTQKESMGWHNMLHTYTLFLCWELRKHSGTFSTKTLERLLQKNQTWLFGNHLVTKTYCKPLENSPLYCCKAWALNSTLSCFGNWINVADLSIGWVLSVFVRWLWCNSLWYWERNLAKFFSKLAMGVRW